MGGSAWAPNRVSNNRDDEKRSFIQREREESAGDQLWELWGKPAIIYPAISTTDQMEE